MIPTRTHHRQTSSISKPMPHPGPIVSPPTSPSAVAGARARRRPSVTSPMTWLARTTSNASTSSAPYAPSRPVRISEPRFADPAEARAHPRTGTLGTGATVVRTPQEALAGPLAFVSSDLHARVRSPSPAHSAILECGEDDQAPSEPPASPPLPPIPDDILESMEAFGELNDSETVDAQELQAELPVRPHAPLRPPPDLPTTPEATPEMRGRSTSPFRRNKSPLDFFPPVPTLPLNVLPPSPQPPFGAILVSPAPTSSLDPSKIIVSLETSTATQRTTMATLISRPSRLASYLVGLFPASDGEPLSVYSTTSDVDVSFNSIFNHHLVSSGVMSQVSTNLHVFLDRPSAPYVHILSYLRSPPSTPGTPASLPHGVRLNGLCARMESLLELRDEACYLGLDELQKLCLDELRHRQASPAPAGMGLGLHMRGFSTSSASASSRSLPVHVFREASEQSQLSKPSSLAESKAAQRKSDDSGFASGEAGARRSGGSAESDGTLWQSSSSKDRIALKPGSPGKSPFTTMKPRPTGNWI
ncbi:uncharacterized protein BXZ73DRAFT_40786 [Epithele typhae]|uniref:uncharacterized protein n=1 Tax=Epithele typhae TaxID=378194 RepID=UPI0020073020|nr:uncharacterized protein BXZ73DRAFT_40786 [Epithele typhae]KAH9943457.1 hypothetical protein BXZ73DRAFT_40786 [Epithele typhae]